MKNAKMMLALAALLMAGVVYEANGSIAQFGCLSSTANDEVSSNLLCKAHYQYPVGTNTCYVQFSAITPYTSLQLLSNPSLGSSTGSKPMAKAYPYVKANTAGNASGNFLSSPGANGYFSFTPSGGSSINTNSGLQTWLAEQKIKSISIPTTTSTSTVSSFMTNEPTIAGWPSISSCN